MGRACLSVRAFDCVGMENSLDGTDSGRARVGRSTARPSSARVRLLVGLARVGRASARPSVCARCGTVDCPSSARVRLLVSLARMRRSTACPSVCARAIATARRVGMGNMGMKKASEHVRLLVGQARLGKLARVVCACTTATARRVGMGSMDMERARRRRWDERACLGRTGPCPPCRIGSSRPC